MGSNPTLVAVGGSSAIRSARSGAGVQRSGSGAARPVTGAPRSATGAPRSGSAAPRSGTAAPRSTGTPPSSRWAAPVPTGTGTAEPLSVPAHVFPHRSPSQLLVLARRGLDEAAEQRVPGRRYASAHLAGLRAAAAVVAARAKPAPRQRSKLTSVWDLLRLVAPELDDWAVYFAASAGKRAAAEAGIRGVVTAREADDLVRAATSFIAVVELALGAVHPGLLDELVA